MKYLSYEGLLYLAGQIKEYIESKVFKRNFESTSSEAKSASGDGVTYFTSDTKQIIKDGVAYGGSLATTQAGTASDQVAIKTVTEENVAFYPKTHADAVEGILKHDFNSQSADIKNLNNDIVYFTTDTNEIIINGISYGKEGFLPLTGGTLNGNLSIAQDNLLSFSDAGTISGDNGTLNIASSAVDIFAPVWADSLEANTIKKTGGTDQQVLMADGSVKELSEVSGGSDYYTKEQIDAMLAGMQQTIDDMRAMLNEAATGEG